MWRVLLPEDRIPDGAYSRPCEQLDVARATELSVSLELTIVAVLNAIYRALDPAPYLRRSGGRGDWPFV